MPFCAMAPVGPIPFTVPFVTEQDVPER